MLWALTRVDFQSKRSFKRRLNLKVFLAWGNVIMPVLKSNKYTLTSKFSTCKNHWNYWLPKYVTAQRQMHRFKIQIKTPCGGSAAQVSEGDSTKLNWRHARPPETSWAMPRWTGIYICANMPLPPSSDLKYAPLNALTCQDALMHSGLRGL